MPIFDFYLPTQILFGVGRLAELERTPHLPAGSRAMSENALETVLKEALCARGAARTSDRH